MNTDLTPPEHLCDELCGLVCEGCAVRTCGWGEGTKEWNCEAGLWLCEECKVPPKVNFNRLATFESYATHPWLGKAYKRLSMAERELVRRFIVDNNNLDKGAFEFKVNRMFLDQPNKPKNYTTILELLICANSAL